MTKYKRKSWIRARQIEVSLSAKGKKGNERLKLSVANLKREDIVDARDPLQWTKIDINGFIYIKYAYATQNTNEYSNGELIVILCTKDGGKIQLDPRFVKYRDVVKIQQTIRALFRQPKTCNLHAN